MSGLRAELRRSIRLTAVAKEEQHRFGHPEVHVEHLMLAVLVAGEEGGNALRQAGLTIEQARRAVEAHHRDQVRQFGIEPTSTTADSVSDTAASRTDWAQPALDAMSTLRGGDGALLNALLDEPSGRVAAILHREGIDVATVRDALKTVPSAVEEQAAPTDGHSVLVRVPGRINAPIEKVWELLADPTRRTEWDHSGAAHVDLHEDGSFTTTSPTHAPDGRRRRIDANRRRVHHTPVATEPPTEIVWAMLYPDLPKDSRVWRRAMILEPDEDGTRIWLEERLDRGRRTGRLHRAALSFFLRNGLEQRIAAIDRSLR